jgi:hypothetical protein
VPKPSKPVVGQNPVVKTPPKKEEPKLKVTPKPTIPVKYDRKDYISNKGKGKGGEGVKGGNGYYGNDNPATNYY